MATLAPARLYVNGSIRGAAANRTYPTISPWTGAATGEAADASCEDVSEAILSARRAFDETGWRDDHQLRFDLLLKLRDLLIIHRPTLIDIARHEVGAALATVERPQVTGSIEALSALLKLVPSMKREESRGRRQSHSTVTDRLILHEAAGVVGAITPWNVPLYSNLVKSASAMLAGCTVILKAAPATPRMATILGELAAEAGFPPGAFNVITASDPAPAGEQLVTDPRVDVITFTGSTAVGKRIMERSAASMKRLFLELGGKSANILLDDTPDFDQAVRQSVVLFHAGQGCSIPTRLLVPRSRYAQAQAVLNQTYAELAERWGDFDDPSQIMGPVISRKQLDRILAYIERGKREGARLLVGGRERPDKGSGFFIEPTCFVDVTNEMTIAREEIFGPVLVVIPFDDESDAVRIANDSDYGLAGYVSSADKNRALRVARQLRAGAVGVNRGHCQADDLPFGGYKRSGLGREGGLEGIQAFTELKVIGIGIP